MQIIQIADLHVMDKSDVTKIKKQIGMLYEAIKGDLNLNDEIVLCVLGDIIYKGDALSYDKAKEIIEYLKDLFKIFNVKFEFTPGNHDLCRCPHVPDIPDICHEKNCSISDYELFLSSLGITYEETDGLNLKEYTEIDLLLASSVFHKNCKYGLLDIDKLITIDFPKPTLILTHHTFLSENDKDNSAIRNATGYSAKSRTKISLAFYMDILMDIKI